MLAKEETFLCNMGDPQFSPKSPGTRNCLVRENTTTLLFSPLRRSSRADGGPPPASSAVVAGLILALLNQGPFFAGALTVVSPPALARSYSSSRFDYYGPRGRSSVEAAAVVLDGAALCAPQRKFVEGKVVVIGELWPSLFVTGCDVRDGLGEIYGRLDQAGAVAVVFVSHVRYFRPGSMVKHFDTIYRCAYCLGHPALLVHAHFDVLMDIAAWKRAGAGENGSLVLLVSNQDSDGDVRLLRAEIESLAWTVLFRCLLASFILWTAVEAGGEVRRVLGVIDQAQLRAARMITLTVSAVEAPALVVLGVAIISGLYGPYDIPVGLANVAYSGLQGSSGFTTFALALHLREEIRVMENEFMLERREIWKTHPRLLIGVAFVTIGSDFVVMATSLTNYYMAHRWATPLSRLFFLTVISNHLTSFPISCIPVLRLAAAPLQLSYSGYAGDVFLLRHEWRRGRLLRGPSPQHQRATG